MFKLHLHHVPTFKHIPNNVDFERFPSIHWWYILENLIQNTKIKTWAGSHANVIRSIKSTDAYPNRLHAYRLMNLASRRYVSKNLKYHSSVELLEIRHISSHRIARWRCSIDPLKKNARNLSVWHTSSSRHGSLADWGGLQSLARTGVFTIPKKSSPPLGSTDRRIAGWLTFDCRVEETRELPLQTGLAFTEVGKSWRRGGGGGGKPRQKTHRAARSRKTSIERHRSQGGTKVWTNWRPRTESSMRSLTRDSMAELFRSRHPIDVTSNHWNFNYSPLDLGHLLERGRSIWNINVTMTSVFSFFLFFLRPPFSRGFERGYLMVREVDSRRWFGYEMEERGNVLGAWWKFSISIWCTVLRVLI